jgi:hypothetical protein
MGRPQRQVLEEELVERIAQSESMCPDKLLGQNDMSEDALLQGTPLEKKMPSIKLPTEKLQHYRRLQWHEREGQRGERRALFIGGSVGGAQGPLM